MAATLKKKYGISSDLIEGSKGIFDVIVDGDLVFSKKDVGRFPEHDEVIEAIGA